MEFKTELVEGRFKRRINRFAALVDIKGAETLVHIANSGRMNEIFVPGYRVYLQPVSGLHRKTGFDLALVDLGHSLCSIDSQLPPLLLQEAFHQGLLPQFTDYDQLKREQTFQDSRIDILVSGSSGSCYIETKSVTLVENGLGLFPGSPTDRGRKHLRTLSKAVQAGHSASVVFVIQREDCNAFSPNDAADPKLGRALREALASGVTAHAYNCRVNLYGVQLNTEVPILL